MKEKEERDPSSYTGIIIVTIGSLLVIAAPFYFIWQFTYDVKKTVDVADIIGGITAPLASLLGSVLVYLTLRSQIRANRLVMKQITDQKKDEALQREKQFFLDQFRLIRRDINEFSIVTDVVGDYQRLIGNQVSQYAMLKGAEAISHALYRMQNISIKDNHRLNTTHYEELKALLETIAKLLMQIKGSRLHPDDKENLKSLISYLVDSKLKGSFEKNLKYRAKEDENEKRGIPDEIFSLYDYVYKESRVYFLLRFGKKTESKNDVDTESKK